MLWRFCLYGFLKNQRYFEPFIVLAFLARGYSFFLIGMLLGFRELCTNLMEIPSGAVADVLGRRRSMILSSTMYVLAFVALGTVRAVPLVFVAMFLYSIGEAFRTGTHKAIIFRWLKLHDRSSEKTRIYGLTRSWSKLGSALSSLVAAAMLVLLENYDIVFWLSAVPAGLNVINFLGYPGELDGRDEKSSPGVRDVLRAFVAGLGQCFSSGSLRRLIGESMCYEGLFKVTQSYLQPILQAMALSLPLLLGLNSDNRTFILVGLIYFVLFLCGSLASRHAANWQGFFKGPDRACDALWWVYLGVFLAVTGYCITLSPILAIGGFLVLFIVQNFWRPILVSRIADDCDEKAMATVLSTESQAKNLFAAAMLPVVGLTVDLMPVRWKFLPPALLGLTVVVVILLLKTVARQRTGKVRA